MGARVLLLCIPLLSLLALVSTSATARPTAEVVESIYARGEYQRALPGETGGGWGKSEQLKSPVRARPHRDRPGARRQRSGSNNSGPELSNVVMWVVIGVVGLLAFTWLAARLSGYTGTGGDEGGSDAPSPGAEVPIEALRSGPLQAAHHLADQGQFAEAIHTLLLGTLERLASHSRLRPAMTSREILQMLSLPDRAQRSLGDLVGAVEITLFGGRTPGPQDFERCVVAFETFLAAADQRAA